MNITFRPVYVGVAENGDARLVFCDDNLVAVLVRLSEMHVEAGRWFLEAGFGRLDGPSHPTFRNLELAEAWILERLTERATRRNAAPP